jgi:hypothetical protein
LFEIQLMQAAASAGSSTNKDNPPAVPVYSRDGKRVVIPVGDYTDATLVHISTTRVAKYRRPPLPHRRALQRRFNAVELTSEFCHGA